MWRTASAYLVQSIIVAIACVPAAYAQTSSSQPAVLELYTSQGCSSCPPADRLLQSYTQRKDIVALTFNVDYWDYLGWKDTLAKRAYSDRQRAYAQARGDGEIYTPQIVINGRAHAVGSRAQQIETAIMQTTSSNPDRRVPLRVEIRNGKLSIQVGSNDAPKPTKPATIWLAAVKNKVTVPVQNGENRGRTLSYYNVVHRLTAIGMWSGSTKVIELMDEDVLQGKADTCAILVQYGKGGPIVAAQWMGS